MMLLRLDSDEICEGLIMTTDNSSDEHGLLQDVRPDVSALASAVLSSLRESPDEALMTIRTSVVRKLVQATLRDGAFNAELLLSELQDSRVAREQVVDIYIPAAARELGTMWIEDEIGFAKVTIASARLQGLLTLLAPPWSAKPCEDGHEINVLMVLQANDAHTLGPHVATAQLRGMGASVRLLFGPSTKTVMQVLEYEHYDLLMFSCCRTDALAPIANMVQRIRGGLNAVPPIALGGLVLNLTDQIKEKTGVDLVTSDVKVAFKLCEKQRLRPRSMAR